MALMHVKRLTKNDESAICNLLEKKSTLYKLELDDSDIAKALPPYSLDGKARAGTSLFYGFYDGDRLVGVMRSYLWEKMPYYTITGKHLYNPEKSLSLYRRFINSTMLAITSDMEAIGRFTYFTVTLLRPTQLRQLASSNEKFLLAKHIEPHKRYDCYIEEIVPPNAVPNAPSFRSMVGDAPRSVPICIKRFSLKYQLRKKEWEESLGLT